MVDSIFLNGKELARSKIRKSIEEFSFVEIINFEKLEGNSKIFFLKESDQTFFQSSKMIKRESLKDKIFSKIFCLLKGNNSKL